jgi:hypothetical protein
MIGGNGIHSGWGGLSSWQQLRTVANVHGEEGGVNINIFA